MKKTLVLLVLLAGVGGVLAGCGDNEAKGAGPLLCRASQLRAQFWTTMPYNMSGLFSGFTVTNNGPSCRLPLQVSWAGVDNASRSLARRVAHATGAWAAGGWSGLRAGTKVLLAVVKGPMGTDY